MKLEYSNSKEQLRAFNTIAARRLAERRGARAQLMVLNVVAWIGIGFGAATLVGLYREVPDISSELNLAVVSFLFAAAVMVAGSVYQERLPANAASAEDSWARIPQSVSAGPDHLEIMVPGVHTRYEWGRFIEVLEDDSAIYLFLDSVNAVVVPKAAFPSPGDLQQFLSWGRSPGKLIHATE